MEPLRFRILKFPWIQSTRFHWNLLRFRIHGFTYFPSTLSPQNHLDSDSTKPSNSDPTNPLNSNHKNLPNSVSRIHWIQILRVHRIQTLRIHWIQIPRIQQIQFHESIEFTSIWIHSDLSDSKQRIHLNSSEPNLRESIQTHRTPIYVNPTKFLWLQTTWIHSNSACAKLRESTRIHCMCICSLFFQSHRVIKVVKGERL